MLKEKLKMMNGVLENGNYQLGQFWFIKEENYKMNIEEQAAQAAAWQDVLEGCTALLEELRW